MSRVKQNFFIFLLYSCCQEMPGHAGILDIPHSTISKGKVGMENGDLGWRPEDFESPIVFVWLTKTKKESLYAVHESCSAVKYHLLVCTPAPEQETMIISKAYVGNGEWRLVNGERSWTCGQESMIPATPSGVPRSRMEIRGQWTLMDFFR